MPIKPILVTCALTIAACAHAQSTRPGLWEITHKTMGNAQMDEGMAQMQKQLAALPPEQRKKMEAMMTQHGGSMPTAAGGGTAMKVCITPEMAARHDLPQQAEGDCTTTIVSRSASSMKMKFACTQPPTSGEGIYTFTGDTGYTMAMTMTATAASGKGTPGTHTMEGSGKWLAADCGNVKPINKAAMAPKAPAK